MQLSLELAQWSVDSERLPATDFVALAERVGGDSCSTRTIVAQVVQLAAASVDNASASVEEVVGSLVDKKLILSATQLLYLREISSEDELVDEKEHVQNILCACVEYMASVHDQDDTLEWIQSTHSTTNASPNTEIDEQNVLDKLEATRETGVPDASVDHFDMDYAAGCGFLKVLQWLHVHRPEGCTAEAMVAAAVYGHLEVVQWLYKHYREVSNVTLAMIHAAIEGELDVLVWLHANTAGGCTACVLSEVLNAPAKYQYKLRHNRLFFTHQRLCVLTTLRWLRLHNQAASRCVRFCIQGQHSASPYPLVLFAIRFADLQVLQYLHKYHIDEFARMDAAWRGVVTVALCVNGSPVHLIGHLHVMQWLFMNHRQVIEWGRIKKYARALDLTDVSDWLERVGVEDESNDE